MDELGNYKMVGEAKFLLFGNAWGGIHLLDLFCKIKDYKVRRVTGFGRNCIFPQRDSMILHWLSLNLKTVPLEKLLLTILPLPLTTTEFQFAAQRRVLSQAMVSQDFRR